MSTMKICLISTPYSHKKFSENLNVVDDEFGVYPPIGLLYVGSILKKLNHNILLIDVHAEKISKRDFLDKIRKFEPELVGVSMHSVYNFFDSLKWIKYIKNEFQKIPILVGGFNFNLYPNEHMKYSEIDFGLAGNVLESLPKFINEFCSTKNFSSISGLYYKRNKKIYSNKNSDICQILDKLPLPDRSLINNKLYHQLISKKSNFSIALSLSGCPYNCNFCSISSIKFNVRSPENIIEEIKDCYYNYNIREIDFFDAVFTINKKRTLEICHLLEKLNLNLIWSCRSRIDSVDEETLRAMAKSGCHRIYYGIESSDKNVLKTIQKNLNLNKVSNCINLTKKYGIKALGFFMIGNEDETIKMAKNSIKYSRELNLDYVQYSMVVPKPFTELEKKTNKYLGYNYWREFMLGNVKEKKIPNLFTKMSKNQILNLTIGAYLMFYFRPKIIIRNLLEIKSFNEFKRYLKASFKLIFQFLKKLTIL